MPERRDPNRIEVELRILQERELDRLRDFSQAFEASVSRLSSYVEGPAAEVAGARMNRAGKGLAAPQGVSGSASVAGGLIGAGAAQLEGDTRPGAPSPTSSLARAEQFGLSTFFNNPLVSLPQGTEDRIMRTNWMRHTAAGVGGALVLPHILNRVPSFGNIGAGFGTMLGAPQAVGFGQEQGLSRQGPIPGLPLGSPAWQAGVGAQLRSARRSWLGFNPNYSIAQSQRLENTMNQLGLAGQTGAGGLANMMQRMEQNTGVSPELQAPFIEQAFRFGTSNIDQMAAAINNLSNIAAASGRNVNQLAQEIASAALATSQQTGGNFGRTVMGLENLVGATGMSVQNASGIMSNQLFGYMAIASNPRTPYSSMTSASGRFQAAQRIATQILGMSPSAMANLKTSNRADWEQRMFRLQQIYMRNPDLLGGMTPDELIGTSTGGARGRVRGLEMIDSGNVQGGLRAAGLSARISEVMGIDNVADRKSKAREMIQEVGQRAREQSRDKLMVGLTPDAKKLLRLIGEDDPSHRNRFAAAADRAVDIGGDVAHYTGWIPGTPW